MKNCTVSSAVSVSRLYAFIIEVRYEEKKCIIVKFVLNYIIIFYSPTGSGLFLRNVVPFPIIGN